MKTLEELEKTTEDIEAVWLKAFKSDEFDLNPIGYNNAHIVFHLRFISDDEMQAIYKRLRELSDKTDEEQSRGVFAIYKEGLARYSTRPPTLIMNGERHEPKETAQEVIDKFFDKYETKSWKIINKAWNQFLAKNEPDEVF